MMTNDYRLRSNEQWLSKGEPWHGTCVKSKLDDRQFIVVAKEFQQTFGENVFTYCEADWNYTAYPDVGFATIYITLKNGHHVSITWGCNTYEKIDALSKKWCQVVLRVRPVLSVSESWDDDNADHITRFIGRFPCTEKTLRKIIKRYEPDFIV